MRRASVIPAVLAFFAAVALTSGPAAPAQAKSFSGEQIQETSEAVLEDFRLRVAEARESGSKPRLRAALIALAASLEWANNFALSTPPEKTLSERAAVYEELTELEEELGNSEEAERYRAKRAELCAGWDLSVC